MLPNRRWALLLVGVLLGGCSDFATAPERTPAELRVTPERVRVMTGESVTFEVELLDENGDVYRAVPSWAPFLISERPDRVELAGTQVTPLAGGANVLQVNFDDLQAEFVVEANPAELDVSVPMVHITQGVQRRRGDVPVIAGRAGLLRVVVQGGDENYYQPLVRAIFHNDGEVVHAATLELEKEGLPVRVVEGDLRYTYDAPVPADVLEPGVGLVVEVDPTGVVPATPGSTLRLPAEGVMDLGVREVPPFRLMMIPVTLAAHANRPSRLTQEHAERVSALTREIYPFGDFQMEVREPYVTQHRLDDIQGWYDLIRDLELLWYDEGSPYYFYGGFNRPAGTNLAGLGFVGFPVAIGTDNADDVIAHEVGHTLNLPHAPCGNPQNPDADYPYSGGGTGVYGYDRRVGALRSPSRYYDLMTYCDPIWISDYNYEKVLEYRDNSPFDGFSRGSAIQAPRRPMLVLRGGVRDGELVLSPALELEGRAEVPDGGRYTLQGLDATGGIVFSVAVDPKPLDHLNASQFLVALPAEVAQPDRVARLRLTGPEGRVERARSQPVAGPRSTMAFQRAPASPGARPTVDWDPAEYPLAVVRDTETGRIRAMSSTGRVSLPDDVDASRLEVLLSDGVETHRARVQR